MRILIVVCAFLLGDICFGQNKSGNPVMLDLCGVEISVGMSKGAVINAVSKDCTIKEVKTLGPDTWVVAKENEGGGFVEFRNGRVSEARISWKSAAPDTSAGVGQAIIKAVNKITESSNTGLPATVKSFISHDPESDFYLLVMLLQNGRRLDIRLLQHAATSKVIVLDVEEAIQ